MSEIRPDIIRRKAGDTCQSSNREKLIDLLKSSAIIADKFTGRIEIVMNQGGLVDVTKHEKVMI
jgi:hypothetical protein